MRRWGPIAFALPGGSFYEDTHVVLLEECILCPLSLVDFLHLQGVELLVIFPSGFPLKSVPENVIFS